MAFTTARTSAVRPARAASAARVSRVSVRMTPSRLIVRAEPEKAAVETAIKEAEKACNDGTAGECAAAWDNVEEISAAISHKKVADALNNDPLEKFCDDNPDADECRVYDD